MAALFFGRTPRHAASRGSWWRSWLAASGAALTLAAATSARAQSGDPAAAEALFQKGRDAMARNDLETACAAFEESNRLDPGPGAMGNLALCEERRGHLSIAWQWFVQVVAKLPPGDSRREIAEQHVADLKQRVPILTIRLAPTAPKGAIVVRDSTELHGASIGTPLPVDPGPHSVVVSAPGSGERRYAIELREHESKELVVEPPGSAAAPGNGGTTPTHADASATTEPHAPDQRRGDRTLGYVLGGIGVAGVGVAAVTGVMALGKKSTSDQECNDQRRTCTQAGKDADSAGRSLMTVSTIGWVVGAVGLAGAGAYFVLTKDKKDDAKVAIRTSIGPSGANASLIGRW